MYIINDRKPRRDKLINTARTKIGREALPKRLALSYKLTFDWLKEGYK